MLAGLSVCLSPAGIINGAKLVQLAIILQAAEQSCYVHSTIESTTNFNRSMPLQSTALVAFITTHALCTMP